MIGLGMMVLLIDQWTKRMVQAHASNRGFSLGGVLRIRSVFNTREIYRRHGAVVALVLAWVAALVSAIILRRFGARFQSQFAALGLGLAFGGAAGNLLDVLRNRRIVDFIDLRWWPIFNLADVAIIAGLVVAFWPPL
jgi:signal peptidase II